MTLLGKCELLLCSCSFGILFKAFDGSVEPCGLESHDDDLQDKESEADEHEAEHLASSEGDEESVLEVLPGSCYALDDNGQVFTSAAFECGPCVSVDGNSHSDVASEDGSGGSDKEGNGGVWEVSWMILFVSAHLLEVNGESKNNGEKGGEDSEI